MDEILKNLLRGTTHLTPSDVRNGVVRGDAMVFGRIEVRTNTAIETEVEGGDVKRTVDIVWTTGAPVVRYSWADDALYTEVLEVSDGAIRMDFLNSGAPILDSHASWGGISAVLGNVENARVENGVGVATIQFANTPDVDIAWKKVRTGVLRFFSVGYRVWKYEVEQRSDGGTTKTAVDWEPLEISLVPIPADAGCTVRAQDQAAPAPIQMERNVDPEITTDAGAAPAAPAAPAAQVEASARAAAVVAERRRQADINAYVRAHPNVNGDLVARALGDEDNAGMSYDEFTRAHVAALAEGQRSSEVTTTISHVREQAPSPTQEIELRGEALTALSMTYLGRAAPEMNAQVRGYANEGLRGAGLAILRMHGERGYDNRDTDEIFGRIFHVRSGGGFATTDLAGLLATPFRASFNAGFQAKLRKLTYESWTGQRLLVDKKKNRDLHIGFPNFKNVREIAEGQTDLPQVYFGEGSAFLQLKTSGFEIVLTRDMRINDQFAAIPVALSRTGQGWAQWEQDKCIAKLLDGSMETDQGIQSIWVDDFNQIDIAALDAAGLKAMKRMLRAQRQNANVGNGLLDTTASRLIVSADLEEEAEVITTPGLITATVLGQANPNSNTRLDYMVMDGLPDGTAFLASDTGLEDVVARLRYILEQGPQFQAAPQYSFNEIRYESWNDFDAGILGNVGVVRAHVGGN